MAERHKQKLADLAADLEAAKLPSSSPKDKAFNISRSASVSTGMPLSHKDVAISDAQRERFQGLELDILLSEFQTVAASKEQVPPDEDDPVEKEPPVEGAEESQWLKEAGLEALTDKVNEGTPITEADLKEETVGFTPLQILAVKHRVDTLNDTLRKAKKAAKSDVRDLFGESPPTPTAAPMRAPSADPEATARMASYTETNSEEPPTIFFNLSEEDQQQACAACASVSHAQVQCLNLIQVTSIIESLARIAVRPTGKTKRPKKKKKGEENQTFGVRLDVVVERDRTIFKDKMGASEVPLLMTRIIDFIVARGAAVGRAMADAAGLHEEGIFRKAGSAARIKTLRQTCEDCKGDVDLAHLDARPHDVSALLKQFLREIPEPLLTSDYIEMFTLAPKLGNPAQQLYALQLLVMLLPRSNRHCLRVLLDFLALVASQSSVNKMTITNLAVVFAPTLFYVPGQKGQKMLKEVDMQVSTAAALRIMLDNNHLLWNVPVDIISQVRFVNEQRVSGRKARGAKDVKRLLSEKSKAPPPVPASHARLRWVNDSREQPPVRAIVCVVKDGQDIEGLNIFDHTTALSILEHIKISEDEFCLAEVGGNIGCRRLDVRMRILPVLKVNPAGALMVMPLSQFASCA